MNSKFRQFRLYMGTYILRSGGGVEWTIKKLANYDTEKRLAWAVEGFIDNYINEDEQLKVEAVVINETKLGAMWNAVVLVTSL